MLLGDLTRDCLPLLIIVTYLLYQAVNPVLVLGPLLSDTVGSSLMTVHRLINRGMPGVPDLHWNIVDVRDVAEAHYRAAFLPDIPTGTRFILSAGERSFVELAKLLSRHYADKVGVVVCVCVCLLVGGRLLVCVPTCCCDTQLRFVSHPPGLCSAHHAPAQPPGEADCSG